MSASANRQLLDRYVELYNAGDLDGVMDLYAEDSVQGMPDGVFEGRSAIHRRLAQELTAFTDVHNTVVSFVEQGDTEVVLREWVGARPRGKQHAILFDDEIANGGTMFEAIRALKAEGVERFTVVCTHGIFAGRAIETFSKLPEVEEIVITDTVPIPPEKRLPNMHILSVAGVFAEAIRCNALGQSVGQLFAFWPDEEHIEPGLIHAE
jgi:ribose-phosphate pyrophosphokinase